DELPAGIPALVTIGERDGRQLMVDLEAFGTLIITGPTEHVDALVSSIATELAAGEDLTDAWVRLIGVDIALDPHLPRASQQDVEGAIEDARRERDEVARSMVEVGM